MHKKVYLVMCSQGSPDSYSESVDSVWDNLEGANSKVGYLNSIYARLKANAPQDPDVFIDNKRESLSEEDFDIWWETEYEEMYDKVLKYWVIENPEFDEFNGAEVKEFILNPY